MKKITNYSIYPSGEWLYPDTEIMELKKEVELHVAIGGNVNFQILTDIITEKKVETVILQQGVPKGVELSVFQLKGARVDENSGKDLYTTLNYEEVKGVVVRQAPYWVYDVVADIENNILLEGRISFFINIKSTKGSIVGEHNVKLTIQIGKEEIAVEILLTVYPVEIVDVQDSRFGIVNWIELKEIAKAHRCEYGSNDFYDIVENYLENLIELRSNFLMLPGGNPIRDENGKVIDFNFSEAEIMGKLALKHGFKCIFGRFVARFKVWDDPIHTLNWDRDIDCCSIEGYRQLEIYFKKWLSIIKSNGWEDVIMQGLVDEPQEPNAYSYRALSGICRQLMPGIKIIDPVETSALLGAIDIWVPKQDSYEKHKEEYQALQALNQEVWTYSCGFPTGIVMDRVLDRPLIVSRLIFWQCFVYGLKGFLHYGYNLYCCESPFEYTCLDFDYTVKGKKLPPGGSHIVYPGTNGKVWSSVRWYMQRAGCEDYELLQILSERDNDRANILAQKVTKTFYEYDTDISNLEQVHKEILNAIIEIKKSNLLDK